MSNLSTFVEMAAKGEYLILDTETTGLAWGEICQIAIVNSLGIPLLDTLVKPVSPIPADATRIHGITNDMVIHAPGWADLVDKVAGILLNRDVVVYNAVYDRKMFHQSGEAANLPKIEWKTYARWWCAMEAYAEYYGEWNSYRHSYRWQSLSNAAYQQGIPIQDAHSALGDCLMTLEVVNRIVRAPIPEK